MKFLAPLAFLFAFVIPIIILLYLLKLKRKKVEISSTLLWRKSIQDFIANVPFQKLRKNLLMFLQLIIAALLIFAIARPYTKLSSFKGKSVILLIDNSASMQTSEENGTRLDIAKNESLKIVNSLRKNDKMMIITFNYRTEILKAFSDDKNALKETVKRIKCADTITDIREALLLVNSLAKTVSNLDVIILSDGNFPEPEKVNKIPNLKFVKIGKNINNIAITDLNIRQNFENPLEYQVFANVSNFGDEIESCLAEINLNENLLASKKVNIPPQKSSPVIFNIPAQREGRLSFTIDKKDVLPTDNKCFAFISKPPKTKILLVTNGNKFLENAIFLIPNLEMKKISHQEFSSYANSVGDYNVVFFDNFLPKEITVGNYVIINAVPEETKIKVGKDKIQYPVIVDWERSHPLFRYVNLGAVNITKSLSMNIKDSGAKAIAETESSPVVVLWGSEQKRMLILGFDLLESDFPLQASFPIFISNLIYWFRQGGGGVLATGGDWQKSMSGDFYQSGAIFGIYKAGDNIPVVLPTGAKDAKITTPLNKSYMLGKEKGSKNNFSQTVNVGFYKIEYTDELGGGDIGKFVGVNLLSAAESNIAPNDTIKIAGEEIKGINEIQPENRELWKTLTLLALLILIIEWIIYCKRAYL